jgi:Flp pilus assembly protein TadD
MILVSCAPHPPTPAQATAARHHNNLGVALLDHGDQEEAVSEFRAALAAWDGSVTARVNLGIALYYGNDHPGAAEALEAALRSVPEEPRAHYMLGLLNYYHTARYDEAVRHFEEVARLDSTDPWTRFYLGLSLSRSGRAGEAVPQLRRAAGLDPGHQAAIYQLSLALRGQGLTREADEALERFKKLRTEFPASATPGVGYMEQGRNAEAAAETEIDRRALRFVPAGAAAPAAFDRGRVAMATRLEGDLDNDGTEETLALEAGRIVLRGGGAGGGPDLTDGAGLRLEEGSRATAAALADVDHDGDLDLHVTRDGQPDLMFRNDGKARFTEIARQAGVEGGEARKTGVAFGDFDNDRAIDFCVSRDGGTPFLFVNNRDGTFAERGAEAGLSGLGAGTGVAAGDVNQDGYLDLLFATPSGRPALFLGRRGLSFERLGEESAPGPVPGADPRCAFHDADLDGDLDVVCADAASVDLGASVVLFLNESIRSEAGRSLTVKVHGLIHPQVLSNLSGIGARVEVRAPGMWLIRDVQAGTGLRVGTGSVLTFGMGDTERLDFIRVQFPSGVRLTRREVASGQTLELQEPAGKFSSCPMIYSWDGERFVFVNDALGFAAMGEWEPPGGWSRPDPDEWVKIEGGRLRPQAGRALVRFVNQLEEVSLSDTLRLVAVDHPADVEVFPDEPNRSAGQDVNPPALRAVRHLRPPLSAKDDHGHSVLDLLARIDGRYQDDFPLMPYRGFARRHSLEIDPGPIHGDPPVLLLHGWTDWGSSSSLRAAWQAGITPEPVSLEAAGPGGSWRITEPDIGMPAGLPRTLVVPLSHGSDRRIRIRTNLVIYWDAIMVGDEAPPDDLRLAELPLSEARLGWIGYPEPAERARTALPSTPASYDYLRRSAGAPWGRIRGAFTRYGDVTELLRRRDDRFVVMNHGEEIALTFDARRLGPPPVGFRRDFLLFVDGYGKDMEINSARPSSVAPLPYHAMQGYPYPAGQGPEPEALDYLLEWNTRPR